MSINKLYILLIFNIFIFSDVLSQEIHFSQFWHTPTLVNPALTGHFSGSYRGNAIYRDQNRNGSAGEYQTVALTIDVPIIRGFREQDWIGGGLMVGYDYAGDTSNLKVNLGGLNVAYHLSLDKKQTRILSIGAQMISGGLTYDQQGWQNTAGILGLVSSVYDGWQAKATDGEIAGGSLNDLQVGFMYNQRGKETDFKIGASVDGILSPARGGGGLFSDEKSIGINGMMSYSHPTNKKTSFTHSILYYSQDGFNAINANSRLFYKMNKEKDLRLIGGLGTRSLRSLILFTGVQSGPWEVGLSYDLDIGGFTPGSNGHHALELGVTYLGIISKKPNPDPIIYCPRI